MIGFFFGIWYDKLKPITDLIRGAEAKLSH